MERSPKRIWRTPLSSPPDLRPPSGEGVFKQGCPRAGTLAFSPVSVIFLRFHLRLFSDAYYHEGHDPRLPCPRGRPDRKGLMFREDGQRAPRPPVPAPLSLLPPAPDGAARPALPGLSADAALAGGGLRPAHGEFFGVCVSPWPTGARCGRPSTATNSPAAGAMPAPSASSWPSASGTSWTDGSTA